MCLLSTTEGQTFSGTDQRCCLQDCLQWLRFCLLWKTDRALQTRIKEHKRAVCVCESNSKVAQHANEFNHNMDFYQATSVDRVTDYHKRVFLEAWHSLREDICLQTLLFKGSIKNFKQKNCLFYQQKILCWYINNNGWCHWYLCH